MPTPPIRVKITPGLNKINAPMDTVQKANKPADKS